MRKLSYLFVSLLLLGICLPTAGAENTEPDLTVYQTIYHPELPELLKPSVVQISLPSVEQFDVLVQDEQSNKFVGSRQGLGFEEAKYSLTVIDSSAILGSASALVDGDLESSAEFDLDHDGGTATFVLRSSSDLTANAFALSLDNNVSLPHLVQISALVNGAWKTVVASKRMTSVSIDFPETTARDWRIEFKHEQPLRVRELNFSTKNKQAEMTGTKVRWLAQPEHSYTIYAGAKAYVKVAKTEAGKLVGEDLQIVPVTLGTAQANSLFVEPDQDQDGIADLNDNCTQIANQDQADIDDNGRGDACEDFDGDSIVNGLDNCPDLPNQSQIDSDNDKLGDSCDDREDRLTEANPWLPWAGMGVAGILVLLIIFQTLRANKDTTHQA